MHRRFQSFHFFHSRHFVHSSRTFTLLRLTIFETESLELL